MDLQKYLAVKQDLGEVKNILDSLHELQGRYLDPDGSIQEAVVKAIVHITDDMDAIKDGFEVD